MATNRKTAVFSISGSVLLVLMALCACGCSKNMERQDYITIGALLPLSGESSDEGLRALNGIQLAKGEINGNGGILGKKLDIIALNDKGDEEYIIRQYNRLKEKGVAAVIGSSYSGVTNVLAQAAVKDGMPVISPTASAPMVTKGRSNVFRAIFIDDYQVEVMAKFAFDSLNAKTAVVMYSENFDTYVHSARTFAEFFTARGGQVVAHEYFSSDSAFGDILRKYVKNQPDIIYCPENFTPAAKLVNTAYDIGMKDTRILGSDAWDGLLAYVYHPGAMENAYYTSPFSFDDKDPLIARFVRDYYEMFSQMPITGSATAYTCVYILAEAITRAQSLGMGDIAAAIKNTELDAITGHINFDEDNNPRTNVYIIQIKGGVYSTYSKMSVGRD